MVYPITNKQFWSSSSSSSSNVTGDAAFFPGIIMPWTNFYAPFVASGETIRHTYPSDIIASFFIDW